MKKIICSITAILLSIFIWGCEKNLNSPEDVNNFFPLTVGKKWHYRIVKSDFDTNKENFFFPKEFTVEVSQQKMIDDRSYYEVKNYFFPGPSLQEPAYMRVEGARVFVLVNDKEYLLYSFDSADSSSWHLPMYVNPTNLEDFYTSRIKLGSDDANFLWWFGTTFGRSEAHWTDVFKQGIGRTKILSSSQAYGEVDWALLP